MKNKVNENDIITVGLIGNPNSGKTSLLNSLSGLSLPVGNWPGKTVEKEEFVLKHKNKKIKIVDLPGAYSLYTFSEEEKITRDFIFNSKIDIIVQVVDVNRLFRNLFMFFELLTLGRKVLLVFNFNREAKNNGLLVNTKKIRNILKTPIVKLEANSGRKTQKLLDKIISYNQKPNKKPLYLKKLLKDKKNIDHQKTYKFIKKKISPFYKNKSSDKKTDKIDSIILNKYTAFPIFLLVMFLLFQLTFTLSKPITDLINWILVFLEGLILKLDFNELLTSFIAEGVLGGLGMILSFLPLIFVLFVLVSILEDSGYLSRTVVLLDRLFHKFGISGASFIPMILGFGCNVPAIMATRIIENKKERLIAILTNSFMSCSARLPVYVLFTSIFFDKNAALVTISLYLIGVLTALIAAFILSKKLNFKGKNRLIVELPPYRKPMIRNVIKRALEQTKQFAKKAGTIIFSFVIIIWLLASFPKETDYGSKDSYIGLIGQFLEPLFKPLGFSHWTIAVALLFGLSAKEVIISALATLYGVGEENLTVSLSSILSPLEAYSLLVFILLYIPCIATIAAVRKETGSFKIAFLQAASTLIVAWVVAFIVYNLGLILGLG